MIEEHDPGNPNPYLPGHYPQVFAPKRYSACRWDYAQDCQGAWAPRVIPKYPCCRIGLLQTNDLGSDHRKNGAHEPERGRDGDTTLHAGSLTWPTHPKRFSGGQDISTRIRRRSSHVTLQGAFSGPPTSLKDIPTRSGESRKLETRAQHRRRRQRKSRAA